MKKGEMGQNRLVLYSTVCERFRLTRQGLCQALPRALPLISCSGSVLGCAWASEKIWAFGCRSGRPPSRIREAGINGLLIGFFNAYREGQRVTRHLLGDIAQQ